MIAMGGDSSLYRVLRPKPQHNLRVEAIYAVGHFLPEEAPRAVLELAHRWLDRQSP